MSEAKSFNISQRILVRRIDDVTRRYKDIMSIQEKTWDNFVADTFQPANPELRPFIERFVLKDVLEGTRLTRWILLSEELTPYLESVQRTTKNYFAGSQM